MNFADRLKEIRKNEGLSQEQLAEKIGVSRQAITKWETGKGLPDIENMVILAEIFKMTLDDLVSEEIASRQKLSKKYVSETVYDIDEAKHFDIKLVSAKQVNIASNNNEKLYIKLESETIEDLTSLLKVKLDENGKRLDVDCVKQKEVSEKMMGNDLYITILLPENYTHHCEVESATGELNLNELNIERLEYDGDADIINIEKCSGSIEFAGKSNYDINIDKIQGKLEIAQIKAMTTLKVSEAADFKVESKKRRTSVFWKKNGVDCESFENPESENVLSINGFKSEVVIDLGI